MTALADLTAAAGATPLPTPAAASSFATPHIIFDDLAGVEPLWRTLEAEGVGSPYQRFDWVQAYVESLAAHERFEPRIIVIRDAADLPILLLPFAVRQRRPPSPVFDASSDAPYTLGTGDRLRVIVFGQDNLSTFTPSTAPGACRCP